MAVPVATLRNAAGLLVLLAASRAALAQTGYAVGANGTIVKTSDGGANWVAQTSGTTWGMYAVHFPVDATTGYAVGWNGTILKTTDGGTTWTDVQDPTKTDALRSVHFPVDATTGYVVGNSGTILKTTDGGTTWIDVQDPTETTILMWVHFPVDAITGYAVGLSGKILKTTDGGANWSSQTSGTTQNLRSVHFPVGATTGYAVGYGGTLLKTTDGGTTPWTDVQDPTKTTTLASVQFPVDASTGYAVGSTGTILKTTDGGTNWNNQTSGTTSNLNGVSFPGSDSTGYVVGSSGTILKTTDGGSNWVAQTSGTTEHLRAVHFPRSDTGYAVGNTGTILKTTNGGINWTSQTSGTTNNFFSVHFPVGVSIGYAVASTGTIRKTTDGGANWVAQTSGTAAHLYAVQFPVDANTGYVTGTTGTILKTIDGGANWNAQTSGTTEHVKSVHFPVDATTGYAVGNNGTILKTTDGGANWNAQTSGTIDQLHSVHFPGDATTGYVVGDNGTIVKTTDGGSNWGSQTSGTSWVLNAVHFPVDATTGYAVGGNGTIRKTTDAGANWNSQTSGTTERLQAVHFPANASRGYATGWNGTILRTTDGGSNWNAQTSGTTEILSGVHFPGDPRLSLSDYVAGQQPDAFRESGAETEAELFGFRLDPGGATVSVTQLVFSLSNIGGLTDGDWLLLDIFVDVDGNGDIDPGETTTVGGAGSVDQGLGRITFSSSFNVSAATHYILRADFPELSDADTVTIDLDPAYITASLTVIGYTTAVVHREGCYYAERYEPWSAGSPDTWEIKDLSSAPFNVPANAVVEVAIRNDKAGFQRFGGVRAVGSGLPRWGQIHQGEQGGVDVVVMHVQTDSSSQIQHYSDVTNDVDFVLLGYWDCGTYVETLQLIKAGASGSWEPHDLAPYGVGAGETAEILLTNSDDFNEWEAGVRAKGTSIERRLDLHEAEGGGLDLATMVVVADATANATIEVYAEDDLSIAFYLLGYWTTPPRPYTQALSVIGSPAMSGTWDDADLGVLGVPGGVVAEVMLANTDPGFEHNMGVRANGSSLGRMLDLHEAEDGGADLGRMHVAVDGSGLIEFYQEDVSAPHTFYLTGYWGIGSSSGPPKIVSWREVEP